MDLETVVKVLLPRALQHATTKARVLDPAGFIRIAADHGNLGHPILTWWGTYSLRVTSSTAP